MRGMYRPFSAGGQSSHCGVWHHGAWFPYCDSSPEPGAHRWHAYERPNTLNTANVREENTKQHLSPSVVHTCRNGYRSLSTSGTTPANTVWHTGRRVQSRHETPATVLPETQININTEHLKCLKHSFSQCWRQDCSYKLASLLLSKSILSQSHLHKSLLPRWTVLMLIISMNEFVLWSIKCQKTVNAEDDPQTEEIHWTVSDEQHNMKILIEKQKIWECTYVVFFFSNFIN